MTAAERQVCDCPGPCGFQPCQVKRTCLRKVLTLMTRSSPGSSNWPRPGPWRTKVSEHAPRIIVLPGIEAMAAVDAGARTDALSWAPNTRRTYVDGWNDFTGRSEFNQSQPP